MPSNCSYSSDILYERCSDEVIIKNNTIDTVITIDGTDTSIVSFTYSRQKLNKIIYNSNSWTTLEYYPSGDLAISDTYYTSGTEKIREYWVFSYNDLNQLQSGRIKKYVNNIQTSVVNIGYKLNDLNQVERVTLNDVLSEEIGYDANGNVASIKDLNSTQSHVYSNDKLNYFKGSVLKYYFGSRYLPIEIFNKNDIIQSTIADNGNINVRDFTTVYNLENLPLKTKIDLNNMQKTVSREFVYSLK